jgi:DNA-binding NtrC family response regulator
MSAKHSTLLIVDDDRLFNDVLRDDLRAAGILVLQAFSGEEGLRIFREQRVDAVLLDQKLPDGEGVDLCSAFLAHNDQVKIIFATAYPEFSLAVQAIKAGAYDYLSKPFELEDLHLTLQRALKTRELERVEELQKFRRGREESKAALFVGSQGGFAEVDRLVDLAAAEKVPVLITGETGTGKNVVAAAIHYRSPLREGPLVGINCAALPETLIESELFGTEKGAFTGATSSRKGLIEMADGGTLLLDEIGEMPLHLQSKLLGVLEDKKVRRLGGTSYRQVDVRIIAATNRDLAAAMKEHLFREDLYYRLNVLHIDLPPLRRHPEDIPALCDHFLNEISRGRHFSVGDDELQRLIDYEWPGNVRELRNIIERSVILQKNGTIHPSQLIRQTPRRDSEKSLYTGTLQLDEVEKMHIKAVLRQLDGNLTRTAKALNIGLSTLKRKIKGYTQD